MHVFELDSTTLAKFSRHLLINLKRAAFADNFHVSAFVRRIVERMHADRQRFGAFFVQKPVHAGAAGDVRHAASAASSTSGGNAAYAAAGAAARWVHPLEAPGGGGMLGALCSAAEHAAPQVLPQGATCMQPRGSALPPERTCEEATAAGAAVAGQGQGAAGSGSPSSPSCGCDLQRPPHAEALFIDPAVYTRNRYGWPILTARLVKSMTTQTRPCRSQALLACCLIVGISTSLWYAQMRRHAL